MTCGQYTVCELSCKHVSGVVLLEGKCEGGEHHYRIEYIRYDAGMRQAYDTLAAALKNTVEQ
eukprot:1829561-Karenia_brevis.AAC.1